MIRVVLVGFMAVGKTTVGKLLADRLRCAFTDLDDAIVASDGRTVSQIFRESGEQAFRDLERSTLRSLITSLHLPDPDQVREKDGIILAVGGGAYVDSESAALLRQYGWTSIFLDAPVEELHRRCGPTAERPLARDENLFRQLYELRRGSYMAADLRVDTGGKTPEQVAHEVAEYVLRCKC